MRDERGFTMIAVIATLVVVLLVSAAALALALRRVGTSMDDRSVARAAAAADAGADVAAFRMNRTLVSAGGAGFLGVPVDTLRQTGCVQAGAGGITVLTPPVDSAYCPMSAEEQLGDGSRFRYTVSLGIDVGGLLADTVVRRVISTGMSGGEVRRVLVTYRLDTSSDDTLRPFKRWRYVACTAVPPNPGNIASGCPDPGY